MKEKFNESAENYLETILVLSKRLPVVRSVDVANELDFQKIECKYRYEESSREESHHCNRCRIYLSYRIRKGNCGYDL